MRGCNRIKGADGGMLTISHRMRRARHYVSPISSMYLILSHDSHCFDRKRRISTCDPKLQRQFLRAWVVLSEGASRAFSFFYSPKILIHLTETHIELRLQTPTHNKNPLSPVSVSYNLFELFGLLWLTTATMTR